MTVRGKVTRDLANTQPLVNGRVELVAPGNGGWTRLLFSTNSKLPNIVRTGADGSFVYKIQWVWFESTTYKVFYVMVTDAAGTFTLAAQIPTDTIIKNGNLTLDINPQTTAAGLWHCPQGISSTPSFACPKTAVCQYPGGAPCYFDPQASLGIANLLTAIDTAIDDGHIAEPDPKLWSLFSLDLLSESEVLAALNNLLLNLGFWDIDPDAITDQIHDRSLPRIPEPTCTDNNDGSCTTGCSVDADCSNFCGTEPFEAGALGAATKGGYCYQGACKCCYRMCDIDMNTGATTSCRCIDCATLDNCTVDTNLIQACFKGVCLFKGQ